METNLTKITVPGWGKVEAMRNEDGSVWVNAKHETGAELIVQWTRSGHGTPHVDEGHVYMDDEAWEKATDTLFDAVTATFWM